MNRIPSLLAFTVALVVCGRARGDLNALPIAYQFQEYQFPNAPDSGHCGRAANASAKLGQVQFAQTHLMEPSWPLFYLAGGRPALVAVHLSGSGASPDVKITVQAKGVVVGSACLAGPDRIPPQAADTVPSLGSLYTMTLPKEWVVPGMSVSVESGAERKVWSADQLQVLSPTEVNLLLAKLEFLDLDDSAWDQIDPEPPDFLANLAGALPASITRVGHFPVSIPFERMVIEGPDFKPLLACRRDAADRAGCGTVNVDNNVELKSALLDFSESIAKALGFYDLGGYFYGRSNLTSLGGIALTSNRIALGSGYSDVFLHELGHALSLPHWQLVYGRSPSGRTEYQYPYGGPGGDGGGRGPSWNWEPTRKLFVSPRCLLSIYPGAGDERKDEMSYMGTLCPEERSGQTGPWIGFSDFSAYSIHWFLNGRDSAYRGQVLDRDTLRPFQVRSSYGDPSPVLDPQGRPTLMRRATQPVEPPGVHDPTRDPRVYLMPQTASSPQFLVYGQYHPTLPQARVIYPPRAFVGHGVALIDPTDSATFAKLKQGSDGPYGLMPFYQHDLVFRFTYTDGTSRTALYPFQTIDFQRTRDTSLYWARGLVNFAMVVPADKPLLKVQLLERPFIACGCDGRGDVGGSGSTINARNFMDSAVVLFERSFEGGVSPTGMVPPASRARSLESLGGRVTVRGLDGRIVRSFALEPGGSLEARVRQQRPGQGVWLVQLATPAGSMARAVLIQ